MLHHTVCKQRLVWRYSTYDTAFQNKYRATDFSIPYFSKRYILHNAWI